MQIMIVQFIRILFLLVFFIVFYCGTFPLYGQTSRILTLEECIDIAMKNSYEIKQVINDLYSDEQNVIAERAQLKSNASFSIEVPNFIDGISENKDLQGVTRYVYTNNVKWKTTTRINFPIFTNGNFSINHDFFYHKQKTKTSDLHKNYSNYAYLEFKQPIFSYHSLSMDIESAELNLEKARLGYKESSVRLTNSVTEDFYNLYRYKTQYEINRSEMNLWENAVTRAQERYVNGEISELELLQLQVALAESRIRFSNNVQMYVNSKEIFKQIIGFPADEEIDIDPDLSYSLLDIDEEEAISIALSHNANIRQAEISVREYELYVIRIKAYSEFKGNIVFTYGLDKKDPVLNNSFNNFDETRSIMLNVSMPLWDWGKNRAQVEAGQVNLSLREISAENTQRYIERDVRNAIGEIKESNRRLAVLEKSEENAIQSYNLSLEKFNLGEISSQDLVLAQRQLTEAKESYLNAFLSFQNALASLRETTFWDFESNTPL